jgi:hypothetical protein
MTLLSDLLPIGLGLGEKLIGGQASRPIEVAAQQSEHDLGRSAPDGRDE